VESAPPGDGAHEVGSGDMWSPLIKHGIMALSSQH
jgi:hypothetical protein